MYTEETAMKKQQVFEKDVVFVKIEGIERRKCVVKWKDNTLRKHCSIARKNEVIERRKCIVKWKDNTLRKQQVSEKDVSSERMEQLKEENTVK